MGKEVPSPAARELVRFIGSSIPKTSDLHSSAAGLAGRLVVDKPQYPTKSVAIFLGLDGEDATPSTFQEFEGKPVVGHVHIISLFFGDVETKLVENEQHWIDSEGNVLEIASDLHKNGATSGNRRLLNEEEKLALLDELESMVE